MCYEIFVRSFFDSDGDGIGDLAGLTQKLDYVNDGNPRSTRSLGARCIWLMPIAASPSYHGYDVKNYYRVNPEYGTTADFKRLVAEAHRRGIRVLVDLVLNHASSQHPYFKEALRDPASPHRSWFRFAPSPSAERGPWGQQVWHKSPRARRVLLRHLHLRDARPELRQSGGPRRRRSRSAASGSPRWAWTASGSTRCRIWSRRAAPLAHTAGTHAVLRDFAASMRRAAPGAFTIGEVWDTTGTVLPYYPDQLDAYFAFELSDALLDAVRTSTARRLLAAYARMQRAMPANRWSPFQRNHDQTRTVTALGGDLRAARLSAELLFTLPGVPFVYYGEELGMTGDKPDPRLRTPMHWTAGRAAGFTTGAAWEPLQPDSATANVAVQNADPGSLLNHYRRLIHLRGANRALGAGDLLPARVERSRRGGVPATRRSRAVLVVANLATTARTGVAISSGDGALRAARYSTRDLLGGAATAPLDVAADGRLRAFTPVATLDARRTYVIELTRDARCSGGRRAPRHGRGVTGVRCAASCAAIARATPLVQPNPSCAGYSPPPARFVRSMTSYFSVIFPVTRYVRRLSASHLVRASIAMSSRPYARAPWTPSHWRAASRSARPTAGPSDERRHEPARRAGTRVRAARRRRALLRRGQPEVQRCGGSHRGAVRHALAGAPTHVVEETARRVVRRGEQCVPAALGRALNQRAAASASPGRPRKRRSAAIVRSAWYSRLLRSTGTSSVVSSVRRSAGSRIQRLEKSHPLSAAARSSDTTPRAGLGKRCASA